MNARRSVSRGLLTISLVTHLAACAAGADTVPVPAEHLPAPNAHIPNEALTECRDPRPEVCTMDYRPVCARRDSGVRCVTAPCPSKDWKTYSNGCTACSDPEVSAYARGACEAP